MKLVGNIFGNLDKTKIFFLSIFLVLAFGCAAFATTFDFWGYTYDVNGNPLNGTNITMTLYNYSNWTDPVYHINSTTSDATGFFNLSGIDIVTDIMYQPKAVHYDGDDADYVGKSLPSFPAQEMQNLNNISFFMKEAATINLTVFGEDLEISELSPSSIDNSFKTGLAYNPNTNRFFVLNSSDYVLVYNSSFGYISSSSGATLNNATALAFCNDTGLLYVANITNITSYNSDWSINSSWNISGYNLTKIFDIECYQGIWYLSTYNGSFTGIIKLNLTPGQPASKTGDVSLDTKYVGSIEHYVGDSAGWYLAYDNSGTFEMEMFSHDWLDILLWKPYTFSKQVDGLVNANGTWYYSSAQDNTTNEFEFAIADKYFNYMIKDTALGYPVAEQFGMENMVQQATIYLPADRNYSIMVYPNCSMPSSYNLNNISAYGQSPHIDIRINVTEVNKWVHGTVTYQGSSVFDNLTVVPYILEPGNMVFGGMAMPYNMSAWRDENWDNISDNNVSDEYNASIGFYNITIPGNTLGNNVLLFVIAKNGTDYYGGFKDITVTAAGTDMEVNVTAHKLIGNETNITMDDASSWNETNITTLMKNFKVLGSSGDPVSFAHIEIQIDYSSYGGAEFSWMVDVDDNDNGTFSIPIYNASISRINIFSQDSAPLKTSLTVADLQNDTVQIQLSQFSPGAIETELTEEENYTVLDYTKGLEYIFNEGWKYLNGTDKLVKYNTTFAYNETVNLSTLTSITNLSAFYIDNETELYMNITHIDNTTNVTDISNLNYTYVSDVDMYENITFVSAIVNISGNLTNVIDMLNTSDSFSLEKRNINDTLGSDLPLGAITVLGDDFGTDLLMAFNDSGTGKIVRYMVVNGYKLTPTSNHDLSKVPNGLTYKEPTNETSDDDFFAYASAQDSTINIFAIDDSFGDLQIGLYKYSDECNVPYPDDSCILGGSEKTFGDDFNPLSVIMGGGKINFRMRKESNNITVQYNNVDMLASGPPDVLFDSSPNATQGQSAMEEAWRFGSQGPEIYDDVLLGIPYNSSAYNDNWDFTVTIDKFYDASWNVIWERGVNTTGQLSGTDYADYNTGDYAPYVNAGMACSKTDSAMSSALCYVDTAKHMIWMKIPHFSGISPVVNGTALDNGASCSANDDCASGHCVHGVCRAGSTYCGDGYCDSGETVSSCPADCDTGGTTGGGAETTTTTGKTHTWIEMSPGVVHEMEIDDSEIGLKQIQLTIKNQANNVKIKVTKQAEKPAQIEHEVSGKVYKYIKIEAENIDSEIIDKATIQFFVDKNWTVENNIDLDKIYLNRYTTQWQRLDTNKIGEEGDNYIYEAETPGFSYFVITGEEKLAEAEPEEEEEEQEEKAEEEEQPEAPKTPTAFWVGLAILLIIILVAVFAWKKDFLK